MDTRRAPQRVREAHLPDEASDVGRDPRAAAARPGPPAPIEPEPAPVPANNRLRADHGHRIQEGSEQPMQPNEDQPIEIGEPRLLRCRTPQDIQLMPKEEVLGFEPCPRPDRGEEKVSQYC